VWKKLHCAGILNSKIFRQVTVEHVPSFRDGVVTDFFLVIVIHIASYGFRRVAILLVVLCDAQL
jgi:hypothetical protein